jgi:hypothetical protein
MNAYKRIILFAGMVLSFLGLNTGLSASNPDVLYNLKGVGVAVETIRPEIEKDGLTQAQLRMDVEEMLRSAGIKVLSEEEKEKSRGKEYLYVNVQVSKTSQDSYVCLVQVQLKELINTVRYRLPALPAAFIPPTQAITWHSTGAMGVTGDLSNVKQAVKDGVNEFIKAYLASNLKPTKPAE